MGRRSDHPGYITERSGSFRLTLRVDGERYRKTFQEASRQDVEDYAREWYRRLQDKAKRREVGLPGSLTASELFSRYEEETLPGLRESTQRSYAQCLKPLRTFFVDELGDPSIEDIRPGHVKQYLSWRRTRGPDGSKRKEPLSNRTLEKDRAVLSAIFSEAAREWEVIDRNPVAPTKAPKVDGRDPVILSDEEYERLLSACEGNDMLWLYVLVLGETGARSKSEALHIRFDDVDLEEGFIWIRSGYQHKTKSGKGRWVPMTRRLRGAMRDHFAEYRMRTYDGERPEYVFHHTTGIRRATPGERIQTLRQSLDSAIERADLPDGFVPHDLRHRRVTKWLADGKNPVHVKEALGHSRLDVTMGYTHLAREHLRSLVDHEDKGKKEALESLR